MTGPLDKSCTGNRCEKKDRCYLYDPRPANPFNCISPMDRYDECPYFAQRTAGWGDGPENDND